MKYCPNCQADTRRTKNGTCSPCNIRLGREKRIRYKARNLLKTEEEKFNNTPKKCSDCQRQLARKRGNWHLANCELDGLTRICNICASLKNKPGLILGKLTAETLVILKTNGCYFHSEKCTKGKTLHLDHAHESGRIRGYLCDFHNTSFLPGLEELAVLYKKDRIEFERWIQYIHNPPTKVFYPK